VPSETPVPGRILFVGKRHYTGKDALEERFGRIFHLPMEWQRSGHEVLLWLVDYHGRVPEQRQADGLNVVSTPVRGLSLWSRFLRALFGFRPRMVVASGDCYIGLLGWLLARLCGARFVFDIYDKYDEFDGYVRPLGFDLFAFLQRRADLRLFASQALARELESQGARHAQPAAIVPNGVDGEAFRPMDREQCRRELGLEPAANLVGYFGGMEPDRGVVDLVDAVQLLRDRGLGVELLLCGRPDADTPLAHEWIRFRGMVPHESMPTYLNATDVLAIPYRLSALMDMGASCKIAEYLACGRPVASTSTPNLLANFPRQAQQLGEAICRPRDPADLARAIEFQLQHRVVAERPGEHLWPEIAARALAAVAAGGGNG
jgi:glycosyltransferase involved in cell wall biosynthesis